jgi:hypothetical protein
VTFPLEGGADAPGALGGWCPMAKKFDPSFQGTKFTIPRASLSNFFSQHPDLMATTCYEVKTKVGSDISQVFVKALKTGSKVAVTKENVASILLLAKKFWLEDLFSECSALMSSSTRELIRALSERIVRLEN